MTRPGVHAMPYGAQCEGKQVRFRLWAPALESVELNLHLEGHWQRRAMQPAEPGWFELRTEEAAPGTLYSYRLPDGLAVPDPASRRQYDDVHGPSVVVDAGTFEWRHRDWLGRRWSDAVIYELHVGTFTLEGSFDGVQRRLDHLVETGITALELMPVGDFPGRRNWGYDGTLIFAPDCCYGSPDALRRLIDAAHGRGLMVLLDVVYNHFGPDGNYLHRYAPQFFTDRVSTPWGAGIDFGRPPVREFFIHNALYWLHEYCLDGLRLDAVHAIVDASSPDVLEELVQRVHGSLDGERQVHLVLENDDNAAHYLARSEAGVTAYTAQWNDDLHHAMHVLTTGEDDGYYADYADRPADHLLRCLTEGFAYQGQVSAYRGGAPRGEPSAALPPGAFIGFLQNHDQVGNRAFGERLAALAAAQAVRAAAAVLLLAPAPPLLFMGEEWGAVQPFLYFCDFPDELAAAVREGRRQEFAKFARFSKPGAAEAIADPTDESAFARSRLDWEHPHQEPYASHLRHTRRLLRLRQTHLAPRQVTGEAAAGTAQRFGRAGVHVVWRLGDGAALTLLANMCRDAAVPAPAAAGTLLYASHDASGSPLTDVEHEPLPGAGPDAANPRPSQLAAWEVRWLLEHGTDARG